MSDPVVASSESSHPSVAEGMRRQAIVALRALDDDADADFRRLTQVAARLFDAPVALISLLDDDKLWFYARHGLDRREAPSAGSLTEAVVKGLDVASLVVLDSAADARFERAALEAIEPPGRFYAGAAVSVYGQKLGVLCVVSPTPRKAVDEALVGQLVELAALCGSLFELKEGARVRARMAADLIKEEWRHALTLEAGRVGSWVWDLRSGEIVANDIFRQMFALGATGPLKVDDVMAKIDRADIEAVNAALTATFEQGVDYNAEFRVGPTGRWLIGRGRVYQRDGTGRPLIMMGVNIDVTEARAAAEQTRVLLRELNHRVKNTLAMIQSLARQTLRQKPHPTQFIDSFSGRLRTLSEAHALLAERDWSGIGLVELIYSQVEPYLLGAGDQLRLEGADVHLPPDQALGLGLVLHELASNAFKYGALSRPEGQVAISWKVSGDGPRRLDLLWRESGGPRISKPKATGFGTRLIERSLDKVLESRVALSFPPQGAEARISLPID